LQLNFILFFTWGLRVTLLQTRGDLIASSKKNPWIATPDEGAQATIVESCAKEKTEQ